MRYLLILCSVFLLLGRVGLATHNRAGEITYRQISELTFEITITTFTYTLSAADRNSLEVNWGDNTLSVAPRIEELYLPNFYKRNKYVTTHIYPGPGIYEIVVQDPNRNYGVLNIPNSVNVVFSIKTTLLINPAIGNNNTPILLNPPIDRAALNHIFVHNPSAFDHDGDSLSYSLTVCTREDGIPIDNYTLPPSSDTLFVDPVTGDLVWDSPVYDGPDDIEEEGFKLIYNIAMNIEEWRNGIKIGNIVRDMQIEVYNSDNNPPVNPEIPDVCVVAGEVIEFSITSTDPDNDLVSHTASGGVFIVPGPLPVDSIFFTTDSDSGYVTSTFRWQTDCSHVREQPYSVIYKVEDNNPELSLVDIDNFNITVLGPPPENLTLVPTSDYIRLHWSPGDCSSVSGYRIYRRMGSYGFIPDSCENGVPSYTGYEFIGETSGWNDTVFIDNGDGNGLLKGTEYCYMIVALFSNGTESIASDEVCSVLIEGLPIITNVSILDTDSGNGSVYLAWAKPDPDTIQIKYGGLGPYKYLIYRTDGIWGENFTLIDSIASPDLEDTTYVDTDVKNTLDRGYLYRVVLFNDNPNRFQIGSPDEASSVFLKIVSGDNKMILHSQKNVPWINSQYVIYRQNPFTLIFDSIDVSMDSIYTDLNLVNGVQYCYQVKTIGTYNRSGIIDPLINYSQENCGIPDDNEPPCPPDLTVRSICDSLYNKLIWTKPDPSCGEDVVSYNIYYKPILEGELQLLASIPSPDITTYIHDPEFTMAGCYAITAIDSFDNESDYSLPVICVDSCSYFEIPNVFTPNGDDINDILYSRSNSKTISRIDMKIYSRTGNLVFETDNPAIEWNGTYNGKYVSPGVYYYFCDVFETRLTGEEVRNISGFIHIITDKKAKLPDEK